MSRLFNSVSSVFSLGLVCTCWTRATVHKDSLKYIVYLIILSPDFLLRPVPLPSLLHFAYMLCVCAHVCNIKTWQKMWCLSLYFTWEGLSRCIYFPVNNTIINKNLLQKKPSNMKSSLKIHTKAWTTQQLKHPRARTTLGHPQSLLSSGHIWIKNPLPQLSITIVLEV